MLKQFTLGLSMFFAALFISSSALADEIPQVQVTIATVSIPVVQPVPETPPRPQITDPWPGVVASLKGGLYSTSAQQRYSALLWQLPMTVTSADYAALVKNGTFVCLEDGPYLEVIAEWKCVRPETAQFVQTMARDYTAAACGRLVVTEAGRLTKVKRRGSSPDTVHPFGMAVDIRLVRIEPRCADWIRTYVLEKEALKLIDGTEHFGTQLHMHLVVPKAPPAMQLAHVR